MAEVLEQLQIFYNLKGSPSLMRYIVEALDTLTIHRKEMFCEATCIEQCFCRAACSPAVQQYRAVWYQYPVFFSPYPLHIVIAHILKWSHIA